MLFKEIGARIFGVIFVMTTISSMAAVEEWDLKKSKDGIQAYTRSVEGHDNLAFRGVTQFSGTVQELVAIHRNVDSMPKWLYTCYDPIVLQDESATSRIIYMKNKTPIVVKERDLVLRQTVKQDAVTHAVITLEGLPNQIEKKSGFVRIKYFKGRWEFTQIEPNIVKVEYVGEIDPSGALPKMVTNLMVVDTPYESLKLLREYAKKAESLARE